MWYRKSSVAPLSLFAEEVEIAKTIIIREADSYLYGHRRVEHGSAVASYEGQSNRREET